MSRTRTRKRTNRTHTTTAAVAATDTLIPVPAQPALRPVPPTGNTPRKGVSLVKLTKLQHRHPHPRHATRQPVETVSPLWLDLHANAAQAALYAGALRIHAPHHTWTGMTTNEATCLINPEDPGSVRLMYAWAPSTLTATQQCRHNQWHLAPIGGPQDLIAFAEEVASCQAHNPRAARARSLGEGIHRATAAVADTQMTAVLTLADAHRADDGPREHPADD